MIKRKLGQPIVSSVLMLLILAACSAPQPTPTTMTPSVQVTRTRDSVYAASLQEEETSWMLDVYAPDEAGNWPVVVFLHGLRATKERHIKDSQAIAERGAVVYAVNWPTWTIDLAEKENGKGFREMSDAVACAIRFARATAAEHGGDPSRVVLAGMSWGARIGAWVALAGKDLDNQWEEYAALHGGPQPQVECVESEVSPAIDAFIGVSGRHEYFERLRDRDLDLWNIVSPYAHIGQDLNLPIRLMHGDRDTFVTPEHSSILNDALAAEGHDVRLILFDGVHQFPAQLTAEVILEVAGEWRQSNNAHEPDDSQEMR